MSFRDFKVMRKFSIFFAVFLCGIANADTLRATNGDVFSGKVITYQDGMCIFRTSYGSNIKVESGSIEAIFTDEVYAVFLNGGDKLIGRLVDHNGGFAIESPAFGIVEIEFHQISYLVRNYSAENEDFREEDGFGEEGQSQPPLNFLTGSTVLLAPGKYELEFGVGYKQVRESYLLPAAGYFQRSSYLARQVTFDASLRGGLHPGVEGWLSIPYSYSYVEQVSTNEYVRDADAWDLGDVSFGLQYQMMSESFTRPAISASFSISSPSGQKRYRNYSETWKDPLDNGSGHWSGMAGLSFVRTTDPAILFGGINYQYYVRNEIDGYNILPGWTAGLYVGLGHALNEDLSIGARVSYSYQSHMEVDGERMYGSDNDVLDVSMSASYRFAGQWVATPQITFDVASGAGAPSISLKIKRQY